MNLLIGKGYLRVYSGPPRSLESLPVEHMDQTSESDINLLSRLAELHDAIATRKERQAAFVRAGQGLSASGRALPAVTIRRQAGDSHRYNLADRDSYTGVRAYYHDAKGAAKKEVIHGKGSEAKGKAKGTKPSADNLKSLRHTYASRANAERPPPLNGPSFSAAMRALA
ncbi:contractile injection system protein, VgrG/Pvc8 family [Chitinimonas arctica]|uniref:contractile injection system protein, VgrG/Pvc8 family n=1 Tax=Chitinimonas arctica TaxID=2594795 RepID=UPI0015D3F43A|nr:contractile injection system protein, VgrG/Pvc8 family [Chitinimonas arctica]